MSATARPQPLFNPRQRAQRILAAWNGSNFSELESLLEESVIGSQQGALVREQAEMLETVSGTIRTWLKTPADLAEGELQASLSLLQHLSAARPLVN